MEAITREIKRIEGEHGVSVLFAAESGSRAWGFESPDSDWDVRFIYVRPVEQYLRCSEPRDTIERSIEADNLDLSGWDLLKACRLLRKSNPQLIEWLDSSIIYRDTCGVRLTFSSLALQHASLLAAGHHYLSMAKTNYKAYIEGADQVRLKKYLYAVRPIMCAQWALEHGTFPPTRFDRVFEGVTLDSKTRSLVNELLDMKRAAGEATVGGRIRDLDQYVSTALEEWHGRVHQLPSPKFPAGPLDDLIQSILLD